VQLYPSERKVECSYMAAKEEVGKKKMKEKMRKNTRKPALPVLRVGVLTGW